MIPRQKLYSSNTLAKPDSSNNEKVFVITLTQMRAINQKAILLDSLTKRYNEMILNYNQTVDEAQRIAKQAFDTSAKIDKHNDQIIAIVNKDNRKLKWQLVWQKVKVPLVGAVLFGVGNFAAQQGFAIKF